MSNLDSENNLSKCSTLWDNACWKTCMQVLVSDGRDINRRTLCTNTIHLVTARRAAGQPSLCPVLDCVRLLHITRILLIQTIFWWSRDDWVSFLTICNLIVLTLQWVSYYYSMSASLPSYSANPKNWLRYLYLESAENKQTSNEVKSLLENIL